MIIAYEDADCPPLPLSARESIFAFCSLTKVHPRSPEDCMTVFGKHPRLQNNFLPAIATLLAIVLAAFFSATASAQIFFSPYKDVTANANWNTGEQQSAVTGTSQAVTSAMLTNDSTLSWAFATGTCGAENWGGISPALESSNAQDSSTPASITSSAPAAPQAPSTAPVTPACKRSSTPTTPPICLEWTTTSSLASPRPSSTT